MGTEGTIKDAHTIACGNPAGVVIEMHRASSLSTEGRHRDEANGRRQDKEDIVKGKVKPFRDGEFD